MLINGTSNNPTMPTIHLVRPEKTNGTKKKSFRYLLSHTIQIKVNEKNKLLLLLLLKFQIDQALLFITNLTKKKLICYK